MGVNHHKVPTNAKIFFCAFSMYQPEDGAAGGLSIAEQLQRTPFANIIKSRPKYGMFVVHATTCQVYSRLWAVYEVDEAMHSGVEIRGLFDIARWTPEKFNQEIKTETRSGQVGRPEDRLMLEELICQRGGFERLDALIADFRGSMQEQLQRVLDLVSPAVKSDPGAWQKRATRKRQDDWVHCSESAFKDSSYSSKAISVTWDHFRHWAEAMAKVDATLGAGIQTQGDVLIAEKRGYDETKFAIYGDCYGLPLGRDSFPHGLPFFYYRYDHY